MAVGACKTNGGGGGLGSSSTSWDLGFGVVCVAKALRYAIGKLKCMRVAYAGVGRMEEITNGVAS